MTPSARRRFLQTAGAFLAAFVSPAWTGAHPRPKPHRRPRFNMYRWSGHGRRVSQAALSHAANRRYLTIGAALRDVPHRKSHLKLVRLDSSLPELLRLFVFRRRLVVDLRNFP